MQESYILGGAELKTSQIHFKVKFHLEIYGKKLRKTAIIQSIKTSDQRKSWLCPIEQPLHVM